MSDALTTCWCLHCLFSHSPSDTSVGYLFVYICSYLPSVLWHCWLSMRNSIRPVKIEWWGVGVVICLDWGAVCLHMVQSMPLHPKTPSSLASFTSRLVLPLWYRLTQVFLEKRPLNECSSSSSYICSYYILILFFRKFPNFAKIWIGACGMSFIEEYIMTS